MVGTHNHPDVLLCHDDFLIVNKPAGIAVQDDAGCPGTGYLQQLRQQLNAPELMLVHRLDKMTSGLLLLARHPEANRQLSELFRERRIDKCYLARSSAKPSKKQGTVLGDMIPGRRGNWLLQKSCKRPACTQFFSVGDGVGGRVLLLRLLTGKTHQIRVALKSLGAPIMGDQRYGGAVYQRGLLHAYALRFYYQQQWVECFSMPDRSDFPQPLPDSWQQPWALPWPQAPASLLKDKS